MKLIMPPFNTPLIDDSKVLTQPYRIFFNNILLIDILQGTGSPEGVVEALIGQEYMDLSGSAGNIKYIKRDSDIAGDRTKGWILI